MASDGEISCTTDPNFAVIYSFLKVFGKLYGLEIPTIAKLQELIENTQEVLEPLKELHLRLLRRAQKSVQSTRWERCLIKFCHQQGHHQEAWEMERFSYKKASTQVKLKVLKFLLEYQFTCHPKFKSAVNALSSKELRLDPIGRCRSGCVYWLQVDDDANLCLYKEDQDEETWQLIARNREELVKVIAQLKNGEEVCPSAEPNTNEDSNSTEIPTQSEPTKIVAEEDNEEEFLSPESESEHEDDNQKTEKHEEETKEPEQPILEEVKDENIETKEPVEIAEPCETSEAPEEPSLKERTPSPKERTPSPKERTPSPKQRTPSPIKEKPLSPKIEEPQSPEVKTSERSPEKPLSPKEEKLSSPKIEETESLTDEKPQSPITETQISSIDKKPDSPKTENPESPKSENPENPKKEDLEPKESQDETVSEAIEEPVMLVTGEGSGADCDSLFLGEEITESVMFFYGEGYGYDNDTGNPEAIERENNDPENSDGENGNDESVNGENHEISNSSKTKLIQSVKLKSKLPSVNKRTLKKQSTETETLKPDTKKHCVRNLDKSDSSNSKSKSVDKDLKRESSVNDKTTDSESPTKNNVKKGRNKVKKKPQVARKLKIKETKEVLNSVTETDNGHDSKTSIIEKRKSSLSSDQDEEHTENEKEKSPDKELKVEDALPPKKLRLETTPESDNPVSHSKDIVDTIDNVNNSEKIQSEDNLNSKTVDTNPISQRKKIKARKGKFKRKRVQKKVEINDNNEETNDDEKQEGVVKNKSLKRSLLDATQSDKNKSESQSESEEDEPVPSGKRLKIKPKKMVKSSRKKVEAKLKEKHPSDESEEETLYSIAGKKSSKKVLKKKPKSKTEKRDKVDKPKAKSDSEDSDIAPVRQSRRIAQLKIKEEAERRHLEEVALRELKMIHKKKSKDDEEEWQASGKSSPESEKRIRKKAAKWRASDSTGPDPDSESDEPLFEHHEPDLDFAHKSDHEFSPESDLESGEPAEPLKRARTLQEEKDDGFCKRCGSGEQPEWILLCDRCDACYHASCLKPVLFLVPEGDWFCPPCNHEMLIAKLESELTKYDELLATVEAERERRKLEEPEKKSEEDVKEEKGKSPSGTSEGSSEWSSSSDEGAVYRLRARRQLPVSYRAQEYDRLISSAIKEEYVEPTTSAGNQGRGKDISTIIEAAEEEKLKAEREAIEQGAPIEIIKKMRKKQRRKPRKLNSLDVPSEDDDETDEDFKDTGMESSSEDISTSAERDSSAHSGSSDDLPIRRACRPEKKDRPKLRESSPEVKKKKKGSLDSSSDGENKEWKKSKSKPKSKKHHHHHHKSRSDKKPRRKGGLTQYDAEGNVIRARVTYGGLSGDEGDNDWSPKHRTRQKKINYTEMPNTESEDEMHKSSGKHMPDSSDEFKIEDSDADSDSGSERGRRRREQESGEERRRALDDLTKKTAVVPLEKLPDDVTKAKTEELQAHLDAQAAAAAAMNARPLRGKGSRGGRGSRGPRGGGGRGRGGGGGGGGSRASPAAANDDALGLVGLKIKDLNPDGTPLRGNDAEREKKRLEREAKLAEKEARKQERLQKKEEKEKMKEQKAKEREEKRLARLASQENKRLKKEKPDYPMSSPMGYGPIPVRPMNPDMQRVGMYNSMPRHPGDYADQRFPPAPRLQVRAELRGVLTGEERRAHASPRPDAPPPGALREGTLSVAGSPQPFKPITEEPSIITRMPHMLNQQYRGPMMYSPNNSPYGPRGPQNMPMYPMHPGLNHQNVRHQYPPQYYSHLRGLPPGYPGQQPMRPGQQSPGPHGPPGPHQQGPHGPQGPHGQQGLHGPPGPHGPHGPPGSHGLQTHGPPGQHGPPASSPHGPPSGPMAHNRPGSVGPPGSSHGPPGPHGPGGMQHGPPGSTHGLPVSAHGPPGSVLHGPPVTAHGPSHGPPGLPHGLPRHMGAHGPPGSMPPHGSPHGPLGLRAGMLPHAGLQSPPARPLVPSTPPAGAGSPAGRTPPGTPGAHPPGTPEAPIKIKAEVKTEPEYRSPPGSPRPPSPRDEPPRPHPKIKHTENKDRRPRFPLGPYAPQYGPYGPYAPPPTTQPSDSLLNLQSRLQQSHQTPLQRMHQIHQFLPTTHTDTKPAESRSPLPRPAGHAERPHLLHDVSPLPPHYLPPHLRQMRPYGMPMMPRHPQPGRSSPGGLPPYSQYPEIHRTALEKQLAAPVSMPPMPREVIQKPPTPQPIEPMPDKPESRESTPVPARPDKEPEDESPPEDPKPEPLMGDNVNKPDEPIKHIKEEIRELHPREEGSVFGGLVSYFSSQREDDIDN